LRRVFNEDDESPIYFSDKKGIITENKTNLVTSSQAEPIFRLLRRIKYIYLPSQLDIDATINELVAEEILPSMVDGY